MYSKIYASISLMSQCTTRHWVDLIEFPKQTKVSTIIPLLTRFRDIFRPLVVGHSFHLLDIMPIKQPLNLTLLLTVWSYPSYFRSKVLAVSLSLYLQLPSPNKKKNTQTQNNKGNEHIGLLLRTKSPPAHLKWIYSIPRGLHIPQTTKSHYHPINLIFWKN